MNISSPKITSTVSGNIDTTCSEQFLKQTIKNKVRRPEISLAVVRHKMNICSCSGNKHHSKKRTVLVHHPDYRRVSFSARNVTLLVTGSVLVVNAMAFSRTLLSVAFLLPAVIHCGGHSLLNALGPNSIPGRYLDRTC